MPSGKPRRSWTREWRSWASVPRTVRMRGGADSRDEAVAEGDLADRRQVYADREDEHARRAEEVARRGTLLATARGVVFVVGVGLVIAGDVAEGGTAVALLVAAAVLAVVFLVLVSRHRRVERWEAWHRTLATLNREGRLRLSRDWDGLDRIQGEGWWAEAPDMDPESHPYAGDLHVFGHASLTRLLGPVTTAPGRRTLSTWLLEGASPGEVEGRQEAVAELGSDLDFRQELAALGRRVEPGGQGALDELLAWAEGPIWLRERRGVVATAWIVPPVTVGLAGLHLAGVLGPLWIIPLVLQLLVRHRVGARMGADFHRATHGGPGIRCYAEQLRHVHERPARADRLRALRSRLEHEGQPVHRGLARLGKLLETAESRHNLFWQGLDLLFLVDVHLHGALERWKAEWGTDVRGWTETLGEVEALAALGSLVHDHPEWAFPEPASEEEPRLRTRDLGHPLLPPDTCVRNDVEVGPPGTFVLVTGSNMSGKSTLLRAVGANLVLAGAGGPVCATAFAFPPVRLWTGMRAEESLEEGISRFMAELLRMRRIVEAARGGGTHDGADGRSAPPILYLLDEVLQGTNTGERRVAVRAVLRHLLEEGALGVVTTHDLTLHDAPDLDRKSRKVHFRETVEEGPEGTRLHFDHRLREGLATTRNALRLLEAVGLGREGEEAEAAKEGEEAAEEADSAS